MTDFFGHDIKIDEHGLPMVTASGEVVLTSGAGTALQDIKIMLETHIGTLFYNSKFGSDVFLWINDENTELNRLAFCMEVKRRLNVHYAVKVGTASCVVSSFDENGFTVSASFQIIEEDHIYNLVVSTDKSMGMVIKDVKY